MAEETRTPFRIVAVSGSLHAPSKATALATTIAAAFEAAFGDREFETHVVEVSELGPQFGGTLRRDLLPASVEAELRHVETADLLVVASPVYRASYTGLFKHLFDFVGQDALVDTPVLLAATGGSDLHSLVIEHQFRPLFGFFRAVGLPVGVYAKDADFEDYRVTSPALTATIERAVAQALPLLHG